MFFALLCSAQDREVSQGPQNTSTQQNQNNNGFNLFDKQKSQVGFGMGGGGTNGFWEIWAQGRYGRFFLDKWNTGVDARLTIGNAFSSFIGGPYTRFYFMKKQFSPVIELNYNFISQKNTRQNQNLKTSGTFAQGLVGLSYLGLGGGFGGEILLNYNLFYDITQKDNNTGQEYNLTNPRTFGFTYRLNYFFEKNLNSF